MRKHLLILLLAIVAACGVKGDPTTPVSDEGSVSEKSLTAAT